MKSKIEYRNDALVITLSCADPAALHAALMQSIAASMNSIACMQCRLMTDEIAPLIDLLRAILPDERALMKAYG